MSENRSYMEMGVLVGYFVWLVLGFYYYYYFIILFVLFYFSDDVVQRGSDHFIIIKLPCTKLN